MTTSNRASIKARNTAVANGVDKRFTTNVTIGGVTYTPAELKAIFLDDNTAIDAAEAAHKKAADQVIVTRAADKKANAMFHALRAYIIAVNGAQANAVLGDFGMEAPKAKATRTAANKAAAAVRAKATRELRGTKGPKAKKSVKSNVQVEVVPVPTASAAPTIEPAASPAPAALPPKPTA